MNSNELVFSVATAAIALSKGLNTDEIALMGAVFTQLGDTLTTISLARGMEQSDEKTSQASA